MNALLLTDRARHVMKVAEERATACQRPFATPELVLLALAVIDMGVGRKAIQILGLDIAEHANAIEVLTSPLASNTQELLRQANSHALSMGKDYVGSEHLALALLTCGECDAATYLAEQGITVPKLLAAIDKLLGRPGNTVNGT